MTMFATHVPGFAGDPRKARRIFILLQFNISMQNDGQEEWVRGDVPRKVAVSFCAALPTGRRHDIRSNPICLQDTSQGCVRSRPFRGWREGGALLFFGSAWEVRCAIVTFFSVNEHRRSYL